MKNTFLFLSALLLTAFIINGCSKDEDNWAGAVAGTYVGTIDFNQAGDATVIITRITDDQLNIKIDFDYIGIGSGNTFHLTYCLDSVSMSSSTTFTINQYDGCRASNATGGGNFNGNTVSFVVYGDNVNATKQ